MKKIFLVYLALLSFVGQAQTQFKFNRSVPVQYDPTSQTPQWADISPDFTLPPGHFYIATAAKQGWTQAQLFSKGVTHWTRGAVSDEGGESAVRALYPGKEYNNVPRIEAILGLSKSGPDEYVNGYNKAWWPNGPLTDEQALAKANAADISAHIFIGETQEGDSYMPTGNRMWYVFWDRLRQRYEERKAQDGKEYLIAANYFTIGLPTLYNLGQETRENHRNMFLSPTATWPTTFFSSGQNLSRTNLFLNAQYMGAPDLENPFEGLWQMELMKKQGIKAGVFLFGVHEWRPNNLTGIRYPEGTLYRAGKIPVAQESVIAYSFLAQEFGSIYVEWGVSPYQPASKKPLDYYYDVHKDSDYWFPNGATSPQTGFPFYGETGPNRYTGGTGDFSHWGQYLWSKTFAPFVNATPYYATYRINGGPWIERRADQTDLVDCYFDRRGFVRVRIADNKIAIMYYNPFADNTRRTIEIKDPLDASKTYTSTIAGNGIHATLINR